MPLSLETSWHEGVDSRAGSRPGSIHHNTPIYVIIKTVVVVVKWTVGVATIDHNSAVTSVVPINTASAAVAFPAGNYLPLMRDWFDAVHPSKG